MGEVFLSEMKSLRDDFEVVGDVRGKGLMLGMELVKNKVCVREKTYPLRRGGGGDLHILYS